ncbi:hypothetical protein AV530_019109 [Patagioenas fasciata monilis]|uniref:Uncharacterized protein n=1 Tax=Patagioenas fasciata monilis TaxID=372326 RepID=A0A1V4KX38_PATFA|nr:hypothetical protein AV530_019109 [Patagioenas fasciata monilis]
MPDCGAQLHKEKGEEAAQKGEISKKRGICGNLCISGDGHRNQQAPVARGRLKPSPWGLAPRGYFPPASPLRFCNPGSK